MADTDNLEVLAERLEQTGDYRILRRVPAVAHYAEPSPGTEFRRGLIVDVETTGLDPTRDKIIELAILPFDFSSEGGLYAVHLGYAGLEDPGALLPELVTRLFGIRCWTGDRLDRASSSAHPVSSARRPPGKSWFRTKQTGELG